MKLRASLSCLFALLVTSASANTEKVIFTAPEAITFTDSNPSLDVLQLETLAHNSSFLSTPLKSIFPSKEAPQGFDHWFLLRDLNPQQRYELRLCWAAVQPTNFWLDVYQISQVFDTPDLISNLATYSEDIERRRPEPRSSPSSSKESVLFLHVRAAADFYTTDKELMSNPPPVDVDLILDPYVFNVFPRSLGPTAVYIVILAVGAWFASGYIWRLLQPAASEKPHKD